MQNAVQKVLENQSEDLINDLRPLVSTKGSTPQEREELARDLFVQTAEVALQKSTQFDSVRPFRLWFLGIARNYLKKQYGSYEKRTISGDSDTDFWETLREAQISDFSDSVINRAWAKELFKRLSADDQEILQLSVCNPDVWLYSF
jgi:DNA-directed RNA polymerase specialized sigma24 family protein